MVIICDAIAEGVSLTRICNENDHLPSWRTILRYVQEDEDAYTQYRNARSLQCEVMRDQILDLVEAALPDDPKQSTSLYFSHSELRIIRQRCFD